MAAELGGAVIREVADQPHPVFRDVVVYTMDRLVPVQTEVEKLRLEVLLLQETLSSERQAFARRLTEAQDTLRTFTEAQEVSHDPVPVPPAIAERDRQDAAVGAAILRVYQPHEYRRIPVVTW